MNFFWILGSSSTFRLFLSYESKKVSGRCPDGDHLQKCKYPTEQPRKTLCTLLNENTCAKGSEREFIHVDNGLWGWGLGHRARSVPRLLLTAPLMCWLSVNVHLPGGMIDSRSQFNPRRFAKNESPRPASAGPAPTPVTTRLGFTSREYCQLYRLVPFQGRTLGRDEVHGGWFAHKCYFSKLDDRRSNCGSEQGDSICTSTASSIAISRVTISYQVRLVTLKSVRFTSYS